MKNLSLILCAVFLMCVISCKDACDGIICNDGVCIDGTCLCDDGYEGTLCDVETRSKYYGSWSGVLSGCTVQTAIGPYDVPEFPVTLEISSSTDGIQTVDVVFGQDNTTATIDGDNFTLNPVGQSFDAGGFEINLIFSGRGTLTTETQLDMDLDIDVMGTVSTCPMTFTKG